MKLPKIPSNLPLVTFVSRYWLLLVIEIGLIKLSLSATLFAKFGTLLLVPVTVITAVVLNLLVTHLWFRGTVDADAHAGKYIEDWKQLTPKERVYAAIAVRAFIFIGTATVVAALVK